MLTTIFNTICYGAVYLTLIGIFICWAIMIFGPVIKALVQVKIAYDKEQAFKRRLASKLRLDLGALLLQEKNKGLANNEVHEEQSSMSENSR